MRSTQRKCLIDHCSWTVTCLGKVAVLIQFVPAYTRMQPTSYLPTEVAWQLRIDKMCATELHPIKVIHWPRRTGSGPPGKYSQFNAVDRRTKVVRRTVPNYSATVCSLTDLLVCSFTVPLFVLMLLLLKFETDKSRGAEKWDTKVAGLGCAPVNHPLKQREAKHPSYGNKGTKPLDLGDNMELHRRRLTSRNKYNNNNTNNNKISTDNGLSTLTLFGYIMLLSNAAHHGAPPSSRDE